MGSFRADDLALQKLNQTTQLQASTWNQTRNYPNHLQLKFRNILNGWEKSPWKLTTRMGIRPLPAYHTLPIYTHPAALELLPSHGNAQHLQELVDLHRNMTSNLTNGMTRESASAYYVWDMHSNAHVREYQCDIYIVSQYCVSLVCV